MKWQAVISGTFADLLLGHGTEGIDLMDRCEAEFERQDALEGADRDAMTMDSERALNRRLFERTVQAAGLAPRLAEFMDRYDLKDRMWDTGHGPRGPSDRLADAARASLRICHQLSPEPGRSLGLAVSTPSHPEPGRLLVSEIHGEARHHVYWRELTADKRAEQARCGQS